MIRSDDLSQALTKRCRFQGDDKPELRLLYERKFRSKWKQLEEQLNADLEEEREHNRKRLESEKQQERQVQNSFEAQIEDIRHQTSENEKSLAKLTQEMETLTRRKAELLPPQDAAAIPAMHSKATSCLLALNDMLQAAHNETRDRLRSSVECTICRNDVRNVILLPCRHFVLCSTCAGKLHECPMCRSKVKEVVQVLTS